MGFRDRLDSRWKSGLWSRVRSSSGFKTINSKNVLVASMAKFAPVKLGLHDATWFWEIPTRFIFHHDVVSMRFMGRVGAFDKVAIGNRRSESSHVRCASMALAVCRGWKETEILRRCCMNTPVQHDFLRANQVAYCNLLSRWKTCVSQAW